MRSSSLCGPVVNSILDIYGGVHPYSEIRPPAFDLLPGAMLDGDDIVNGIDLAIWETNSGLTGTPPPPLPGDADGDDDVDGADLMQILGDFGGPPSLAVASTAAVPEPSALLLALVGICCSGLGRVNR